MSIDQQAHLAVAAPSRAERDELRQAAAGAVERHFPLSTTRRRDARDPLDRDAWRALCRELDPVGLALPREHGGEALGLEHTVALAAAAGSVVAPAPLTITLALVPLLVDAAPDLITAVSSGDVVVATAAVDAGACAESAVTGILPAVAFGADADLLVLTVPAGDVVRVLVIDAHHASVQAERLSAVDATTPRAQVRLTDAPVLVSGTVPRAVHDATTDAAMVLAAAAAIGAGRRLFDLAVGYVGVRHQFGKPVGSFQAVQHRLADLYGELESAGAAVDRAARSVERARTAGIPDGRHDALVAMVRAAAAGEVVAREALHLHGGIGFTLEHDAHLYLKRSLTDRQLFGGREVLLEQLADHLSLDPH